ncbi:ribosomal protein S18-alanine N-acetyltransferase [bacterium]|nr:ribosomal protein S18-alanine N-acetyltransferase [bacterium]
MNSEIEIVPMTSAHLQEVADLDALAHKNDKWTVDMFAVELERGYTRYWAALADGRPIGAIGIWVFFDEAEIATVTVHPDWQGRGIGTRLMAEAVRQAVNEGVDKATLEVRVDNEPALSIYKRFGFKKVHVRRRYYANGEDAFLMKAEKWQSREFAESVDDILQRWKLKDRKAD